MRARALTLPAALAPARCPQREYTLTAVMKLSTRVGGEDARIRAIIGKYANHVDEELQQRSVEYAAIFALHNDFRPKLLERMPVMEAKPEDAPGTSPGGGHATQSASVTVAAPQDGGDLLLDLLGDGPVSSAPMTGGGGGDALDLLGGLLGDTPSSTGASDGLGDLLGDLGGLNMMPSAGSAGPIDLMGGLDDLLGGASSSSTQMPMADPVGCPRTSTCTSTRTRTRTRTRM